MDSFILENLVRQNFDEFYRQRLIKLTGVTLSDILHKKNLYLLCATHGSSVSIIVEKLLIEHISSSDENIFGQTFMESVASIEHEDIESSIEKSYVSYTAIALINLMSNNSTYNSREYDRERAKALNRLEHDFLNNFGNTDGSIDWKKLLRYNSGKENVPWVSKVIPASLEDLEDDEADESYDGIDG